MKKILATCALLAALPIALFADSAHSNPAVFTQPDGTQITLQLMGDEYYHYLVNEQGEVMEKEADGFYRPQGKLTHQQFIQRRKAAQARWYAPQAVQFGSFYPAPKGLVIVVNFTDLTCQPATTTASINEMCNGEDYSFEDAYGSAREYFETQSGGSYVPQFDVFGPIPLAHGFAYYGENDDRGSDMRAAEAVIEACQYINANYDVNFVDYDSDNDGVVDFIYMLYAGHAENFTGADPNLIWPHQWNVQYYTDPVYLDGVALGKYACSSELNYLTGTERAGIGTLCHEFSHILGLPDYYDTKYGENHQNYLFPGKWDIMAGGNHNASGKSPCNYSVHEKFAFGWATPTLLTGTQTLSLNPSSSYYYVAKDGQPKMHNSPDTVYYIENRQLTGWDRGLPGHGLMIWRVVFDQDKWNQNTPNAVAGEANYIHMPAGGSYSEGGSASDPFPGALRIRSWDVPNTLYSFLNITEVGDIVTCRFVEGCDGYTVNITTPNVTVNTSQTSTCYPANAPFVATMNVRKNYQIVGVDVKMGGIVLTQGTDYTFINNVLTIPSLTGNTEIKVNTEKIPFDHKECMFFFWHPDSAVIGNSPILGDLAWTLAVEGSPLRGFDDGEKARGAQFGSRSKSPVRVQMHTNEMDSCLITSVHIKACVASGTAEVEVIVDNESLGTKTLTTDVNEYVFENPEEWHGAVDIDFSELEKALFIKEIYIHFADETPNPNDLELLPAGKPEGAIIGIYSITGHFMGLQPENLPRGLYLFRRTDGTEKVVIQ